MDTLDLILAVLGIAAVFGLVGASWFWIMKKDVQDVEED